MIVAMEIITNSQIEIYAFVEKTYSNPGKHKYPKLKIDEK